MTVATRDKFREALKRRYTLTPDLPVFGQVRLQSLSDRQRRRIDASKVGDDGEVDISKYEEVFGWMAVEAVIDENGDRIFSDADVEWLCELDSNATEPLRECIEEHCQLGRHRKSQATLRDMLERDPGLMSIMALCLRAGELNYRKVMEEMEGEDIDRWYAFMQLASKNGEADPQWMTPEEFEAEWKGFEEEEEFEPEVNFGSKGVIEDELDMTPMVDIVFLLLIFFMVTASFTLQKSMQQPPMATGGHRRCEPR